MIYEIINIFIILIKRKMKKIKKISLIIDCDFEYNEREYIYIHPEGGYILSQSCGVWINGSSTTRTASSNGTYSFEVEDYSGN